MRKAEVKTLEMYGGPTSDPSDTSVAVAALPAATTYKAATREVSYATEKPGYKSGTSATAKTPGEGC